MKLLLAVTYGPVVLAFIQLDSDPGCGALYGAQIT